MVLQGLLLVVVESLKTLRVNTIHFGTSLEETEVLVMLIMVMVKDSNGGTNVDDKEPCYRDD